MRLTILCYSLVAMFAISIVACKKTEPDFSLNEEDKTFLNEASKINTGIIRINKLAIGKITDSIVQPYVYNMLALDTPAQKDLIIMGNIVGAPINEALNPIDSMTITQLDTLAGREFDSVLMVTSIRRYQNAIDVFANHQPKGRQPNVIAYAKTHQARMLLNRQRADSIVVNIFK